MFEEEYSVICYRSVTL